MLEGGEDMCHKEKTMRRISVFLALLAVLGNGGCKESDNQTRGDGQAQSQPTISACPLCDDQIAEDTYCAGCNAVATTETDLVHCSKCEKDFKPGTYCAACNRFMLNAKVHCGNCQDLVIKGHYCPNEKLYKGLIGIAYCEEHERPHAEGSACPTCRETQVGTGS
jgi:hypothetical protein